MFMALLLCIVAHLACSERQHKRRQPLEGRTKHPTEHPVVDQALGVPTLPREKFSISSPFPSPLPLLSIFCFLLFKFQFF